MQSKSVRIVLALAGSLAALTVTSPLYAQNTVTTLLASGPAGVKKDLVIIGDGFTLAEQGIFDQWVQSQIVDGLFGPGRFFGENANSFNIYRINAISTDSGVTQISKDAECDANPAHTQPWGTVNPGAYPCKDTCQTCGAGVHEQVTVARTTALDYRYSGVWCRCWVEAGPDFATRYKAILDALVPEADYVLLVLNELSGGACGGGGRGTVTRATGWETIEHEFGHAMGGLKDEYDKVNVYTGAEPAGVNVTATASPVKWSDFVDPATALPTIAGPGVDPATVGAFEGAMYHDQGLFRPQQACRMRHEHAAPFCAVCYHQMRSVLEQANDHSFERSYAGDFDGDGDADLLVHYGNSLLAYRSTGEQLELYWTAAGVLDAAWAEIAKGDRFLVADFDGDGDDDLYVYNFTDWTKPYFAMLRSDGANGFTTTRTYVLELPNWDDMRANDRFYVADFDGDGRDDVVVFNAQDWSEIYLGMLRSTGTELVNVRNYIEELPGWDDMKVGDQFFVGDFNADGKKDLYVFNHGDWSMGYLGMLRSNGNSLTMAMRYDDYIPGWDTMEASDLFHVADLDGDQRDDLYIFNGWDWGPIYLGLFRSTGGALQQVSLHADSIPGWGTLAPNDRFGPADLNGDGRDDLWVLNLQDWKNGPFLGLLGSSGAALQGAIQGPQLGQWKLGTADRLLPGDLDADGDADLVIRNPQWLGLLRSEDGSRVTQTRIYPKWIYNTPYHVNGWW